MSAGVFIVGAGCVFPSGPRLALADSAVRMPMALFRKHPFWVDRCGQRPTVSCFPAGGAQPTGSGRMPEERFSGNRWAELVTSALKDLARSLQPWNGASAHQPEPIPCALWLVLPDAATPGVPADAVSAMDAALQSTEVRARWHWQRGTIVRGGHAAGVLALQQAQAFVQSQSENPGDALRPLLAVVLAVDCPLAAERLAMLDEQNLLQGANQRTWGQARAHPYGRIPGEGAAAVALSQIPLSSLNAMSVENAPRQESTPRTWSARYLEAAQQTAMEAAVPDHQPWAQLLGIGIGQEDITWAVTQAQSKPCLGLGLTRAVFAAVEQAGHGHRHLPAGSSPPPITRITTDLNGEPYRGDELGFTVLRLARQASADERQAASPTLHDGWKRSTPALASGDLGSASAIAHTALAAYGLRHRANAANPAPADCHLVLASSDDPLRGAVLLGSLHQIESS